MNKLLLDTIDKICNITFLGIHDIQVLILDVDDKFIKIQYVKSQKIKMIKICFISSITILKS